MIFNSFNRFRIGGVCLLFLVACQDTAALKTRLINQTITEKIEAHKSKKKAACIEAALEEAKIKADSQMILLALRKQDTSVIVERPSKPVRPDLLLPVDTSPIKPLFKDSLSSFPDSIR